MQPIVIKSDVAFIIKSDVALWKIKKKRKKEKGKLKNVRNLLYDRKFISNEISIEYVFTRDIRLLNSVLFVPG